MTAGSLLVLAPGADAATGGYVALGDSYSAGVGSTSDYLNDCDQSDAAYPALYDQAEAPGSFGFEACTGATAPDIESSQLSALNSGTTVVSLTDGGDDVGFSSVMEDCVLYSQSTCLSDISSAENEATTTLPATLATLYADIRKDAPQAKVVVMGYPELYDLSQSSGCSGLSTKSRTALNGAADTLDSVIKAAVAKDSGFTFADVRGYFSGHEICDSDSWLNSVTWPIDDSYHPTAEGQADAYLPAFEAAL
ncbi:SGNH/GDSL hydrolase family protein [Streptacidiphilus sp. PB12-B1b]|uniref:SGNH/GDSL hydrolase family protein n=1 Tax=Streptacidiphilus sp. PB12-B1b TaxID=2705012 RepID=UPI0015FE3C40|nr:SGNH/GDSL hydrolase family protein [Streptacidiphilus sp. PB12-B1b]QMU80397.1 SGNH/GDSL hydrolase family protein [Streptacidiphilus sp. PB12-B1b]